ncbi:hypothetical protein BGZ49_005747, partial [Haplosporangium sp. Z 27]
LQDLFHKTNFTQNFIAEWCEEKREYIQHFSEVGPDQETDDSYTSEVEGKTEDEFTLEIVPRQRPIEIPEDRARRKAAFIQAGTDQNDSTPSVDHNNAETELEKKFEYQERLAKATWDANEMCRTQKYKAQYGRGKSELKKDVD